jgi:hypothetical protein
MFEIYEDMRVDPREFIEADDKVVVIGRAFATARGSGMPLDTQIAFVWTARAGSWCATRSSRIGARPLKPPGFRSRPCGKPITARRAACERLLALLVGSEPSQLRRIYEAHLPPIAASRWRALRTIRHET